MRRWVTSIALGLLSGCTFLTSRPPTIVGKARPPVPIASVAVVASDPTTSTVAGTRCELLAFIPNVAVLDPNAAVPLPRALSEAAAAGGNLLLVHASVTDLSSSTVTDRGSTTTRTSEIGGLYGTAWTCPEPALAELKGAG